MYVAYLRDEKPRNNKAVIRNRHKCLHILLQTAGIQGKTGQAKGQKVSSYYSR